MLIRYYLSQKDCDYTDCRMIHSVHFNDNYSEYIRALKVVNSIYIDEYFYNLDFIAFNPAEDDEHIDCIDVYVKEP